MITDDQVAELFAEANPVPDLDALNADSVLDNGPRNSTSERSREMVSVDTERREERNRRPMALAGLGVVLAAVIALPLLMSGGDQAEIAAPANTEAEALQVAEDFFAALTRGDVDGAMALLAPYMREREFNKPAVEFFAALPGTKTLTDCTASEGRTIVGVSCTTNYNGPLMEAVGEESKGTFKLENGLITSFIPGSREATAAAFAAYASQTHPEAYDQACNPESYEVASVRTARDQTRKNVLLVFAGPCGELWAQVAEDAAAWVEAGRPRIGQQD